MLWQIYEGILNNCFLPFSICGEFVRTYHPYKSFGNGDEQFFLKLVDLVTRNHDLKRSISHNLNSSINHDLNSSINHDLNSSISQYDLSIRLLT